MEIESSNKRSNYFKRLTIKKYFLLFTLVVILVGGYFASKKVQTKGYSGILDFVSTVTSNYFDGLNAHPEEISIEIKEDDYKKLEKNRKRALERGVIINDMDGEYVSATIFYNGKKIDVKLRLKGHMTDHLQNDKWSFRIKTKGNDDFMGMKRFSIQHPGTRGYIYEWIYHELMKQEDIIALRYKFINVKVNGNDWGVYAVEENFESELVENNNRKTGPILRFNPDLYWINRYNMMIKESASDEYASYYSANPEAYRENKVLGDSIQYRYYLKAIGLIEGLRSRTIAVEDAFDIPRLAKFHAIIDLVGGTHSIDWSDIKYYYNPVTSRLEPVAYESFTNLDSRNLSCLYKYSQIDSGAYYSDWHTMIFSNPIFFKEYLKQLERISTSEYLDSFFNKSNITLNENLAIIHKEFPYKKFESSAYYKRQKMISKIIDSPKPLHAYLKKIEGNTLKIQIAAIDALPVIIKSVYIHPNILVNLRSQ
ncbi:MAG: CotH kinase family protein [Bacteroidetes bacterium]|nr:CotH kinase family protein [Bacteroidota bacterium]